MDTSIVTQNRRARRSKVLLSATLETHRGMLTVTLRNLSSQGALVEGDNLPLEGSDVLFRRNDIVERGTVIWVNGRHAGVAFNEPLPAEQVLRHVPTPQPKVQPRFYRPGFSCRKLTPDERRLIESWVWAPTAERPGD